ncbi:hypothetical protein QQF64_006332 [Cirrhinus molitorella]|uniref:Cilia- and flagella-associated protein 36 n=1 Tax=Cirrhinus molitorella TaxID=172907 RepID=A0ABR3MET1_9TELE
MMHRKTGMESWMSQEQEELGWNPEPWKDRTLLKCRWDFLKSSVKVIRCSRREWDKVDAGIVLAAYADETKGSEMFVIAFGFDLLSVTYAVVKLEESDQQKVSSRSDAGGGVAQPNKPACNSAKKEKKRPWERNTASSDELISPVIMADDSEWVLESIAGYLSSPDWLIPLADFMENKCSVFDDEDENKLTYTEIHQQYKQLVERLLENYMQEVGIGEQQFMQACSSFSKSKTLQAVFQPVLATDDFQMFRSLMIQKNMELQLQALHVIKERNGGLPECLTDGVDVMNELEQQEMKILQEVLRRSKEEYDLEMAHRIEEKEEQASTSSSLSETPLCDSVSQQTNAINGTTDAKELKLKESESAAVKSSATVTPSCKSKALPAVRAPVKGSVSANNTLSPENQRDEDTQRDSKALTDEEALQQRSEYLKQQRDKLQALKRDQTQKSPSDTPPAALEAKPPAQEISVEEKKKLQKRKHLAEKLKEEVIKK